MVRRWKHEEEWRFIKELKQKTASSEETKECLKRHYSNRKIAKKPDWSPSALHFSTFILMITTPNLIVEEFSEIPRQSRKIYQQSIGEDGSGSIYRSLPKKVFLRDIRVVEDPSSASSSVSLICLLITSSTMGPFKSQWMAAVRMYHRALTMFRNTFFCNVWMTLFDSFANHQSWIT